MVYVFALLAISCAYTCACTILLTAKSAYLTSWIPSRYLEVYKAWFTFHFSHRFEVQHLEATAGMFGIPIALTHKGYAAATLRSLGEAAQTASEVIGAKQLASGLLALKR